MTEASRMVAAAVADSGMTQAMVGELLGVSPQHVSDLVHGRRKISARMAVRMERVFGLAASVLLHAELTEDLAAARRDEANHAYWKGGVCGRVHD